MSRLRGRAKTAIGLAALVWVGTIAAGRGLAADLDAIRERGRLVAAVKVNSPPLAFEGEDGTLQGLEVDVAHRLAATLLGDPEAIELVPVENAERIPALLADRVDVVVARLTVTEQRSRLVNFSYPYYYDGAALITQQPQIQSLGQIGAGPVAVLRGSTTIDALRWHLPGVELIGVGSYQEAFSLLEAGEAAAFGADASVLVGWVQEHPQYRLLPTLLSAEALAVALPKGLQYQSLRQQVDEAIGAWRETGWLRARIRHWGLPLDSLNQTGQTGVPR